jgi:hypothetical protein
MRKNSTFWGTTKLYVKKEQPFSANNVCTDHLVIKKPQIRRLKKR